MEKTAGRLSMQEQTDLALEIAQKILKEAANEEFAVLSLVTHLIYGPQYRLVSDG